MILINIHNQQAELRIPRLTQDRTDGLYKIEIINNIGFQQYIFDGLQDQGDAYNYKFIVLFDEIPFQGEHTLRLFKNDDLIVEDLARISVECGCCDDYYFEADVQKIYLKGEKGDKGEQGPQGPQGEPGTTDYNELENKPDLSIYETKYNSLINSIRKLDDYLYEIEYNDQYNYEYAKQYFEQANDVDDFGCSIMTNGDIYCRNLDWYYSNNVEFVVKTARTSNSYANIGICHSVDSLTKDVVESGEWNEDYRIIPFRIVDGMNEYGLYCNVNVVSSKDLDTQTTGTTPIIEQRDRICTKMLTRYILDKFRTAQEAVDYLANYVSIYTLDGEYDYHYIVSDENDSFVIEFVDNAMVILDNQNIMTNFRLNGVDIINNEVDYTSVSKYGAGVERFNKLLTLVDDIGGSADDCIELMKDVWYTKTYQNNTNWYTEFTGDYTEQLGYELTVNDAFNNPQMFNDVISYAQGLYNNRNRNNPVTWQTVHTAIYDRTNSKLSLVVQENDENQFVFDVPVSNNDANDAQVTINQGGVLKGSFTLNQENDVTIDLNNGYNHWFGTQEEYDELEEKDENTIYHIEGTLFSGDYDDLTNKPTLFSGDYDDLTNKPTLFSGDYDDLTNKPTLFSGDYDDLTNKPTIPSNTESWVFTLEDDTTITKTIYVQ